MSIFRKKLVSALLAVSMLGAFSAVTVYADEFDTPVTDNNFTTDTGDTGEIPPSPPVVDDVPPVEDIPDDSYQEPDDGGEYDDSGNSSDTDVPDEDISDDDSDDSSDSYDDTDYSSDYDSDDYYYSYDDSYYSDYNYYDYNYGMSFDDFERATDYSASVDTDTPMVDMYNSNGTGKVTLSNEDWNDIRLNFNKTSVGGVGDFSFIKDNTSDENSNYSILFLIFGIVFVATSIMLMIYLISSSVRSRKLAKAGVYETGKKYKGNRKNNSSDGNKRTKFIYDTAEIDISKYDDNF
ncbi:MAG: hypothetical protein UD936_00825 [Acutalibacteraceae bacterium]|nr:hypothetical protein [Acutalibacteraceae bacterium]